ncbi:AAA family ATPase [Clostridioides sp. ES-S-0005-03]|uniref:AAA family ATPase n=1 Tax=Clostridioides sp. ES-S-0005-03 TaxID=2770774 RepID=UPI001D10DE4E|nr:AAA family ATPase [Clostridioides sp. ES-S-0005-03]UDN47609.1 AAA family ATPase [Clostridioides sp. ES-S-0173-01]
MEEKYYQAKLDGTYERSIEPSGPNTSRIKNILETSLKSYGWDVEFDNLKSNPYHGILRNTGLDIDMYIYCWRASNGGRENRPMEKRIQISSSADRIPLARNNDESNRTLLLGIYEPDIISDSEYNTPIIIAWESKKNKNAGSSKSCFTDVNHISRAMRDGFAQYYNSTGDLVCAFKPEFIHFYIMNLNNLHKQECACINSITSTSDIISENIEDSLYNTVTQYSNNKDHGVDKNTILYGPPGTGKTYNIAKYVVRIIEGKTESEINTEEYKDIIDRFNRYKVDGHAIFTTFHQSYSYEEFIEGIKPVIKNKEENNNEPNSDISYTVEDGIFKEFCSKASKDEQQNNYVFIIDEINRGNMSKIFGELITLIENKKRIGSEEAMTLKLPYSKSEFGVPKNIYILGTMNTADRSIALLDTALRRRFEFIEMMPDVNILNQLNNGTDIEINSSGKVINVCEIIRTINKRIEVLYDREHTIGHAYFIELVKKEATLEDLERTLKKKIIPLLQEYFYDDYDKIRLILGDNQVDDSRLHFIKEENIDSRLFGNDFDLDDRKLFKINEEAFKEPNSYIKIYSKINEEGIYNE